MRTFLWGLLIDVGTAVVVILMTAFTNIQWTKDYWVALGLAIAKSVLVAIVSYFARFLIKPAGTTQ